MLKVSDVVSSSIDIVTGQTFAVFFSSQRILYVERAEIPAFGHKIKDQIWIENTEMTRKSSHENISTSFSKRKTVRTGILNPWRTIMLLLYHNCIPGLFSKFLEQQLSRVAILWWSTMLIPLDR